MPAPSRDSVSPGYLVGGALATQYDDWDPKENGVWDDIYKDLKVVADRLTASHRLKHGRLEDGYNKVCTVVFVFVVVVIVLNQFLNCSFLPSVLSSYVAVASYC
jgi:hypothetical protein